MDEFAGGREIYLVDDYSAGYEEGFEAGQDGAVFFFELYARSDLDTRNLLKKYLKLFFPA